MEQPLPLPSSSANHLSPFHFPNINLSSPTPPPADKNDYFDQLPVSHPPKPARPLHQKAQSETAMRLELPHSFPSSSSHLTQIPMLRKKSGEVVRSSLKLVPNPPAVSRSTSYASTRSAPSTPVSGPKAVHFDSHLEHVRHFLSQQRPMAVSRDGSPIETETEGEEEYPFPDMAHPLDGTGRNLSNNPNRTKLVIELLNMPLAERPPMKVCLKSIELAPDAKNLQGIVHVENLHFEKRVAVRFTFDKWQTVSEVTADYLSSARPSSRLDLRPSVDLFTFTIKLQDVLARIDGREMEIAVRYQAAGGEYWDNNSNSNYHIRFKHLRTNHHPPTSQESSSHQLLNNPSQKTLSTPTANDSCPWAVTLRAELDRLVGDDLGISSVTDGNGLKKKIPNSTGNSPGFGGSSSVARLKPGSGLSARYDFSSSLKQAASSVKQQSNRSNRFELSLPFPVSPVPIEWLGVMPINSDSSTRRSSTTGYTTHFETPPSSNDLHSSTIQHEHRDPLVNHSSSYKRWTIPAAVHLPHLPPSPPQESPNLGHILNHSQRATAEGMNKLEHNNHSHDADGNNTGSKLIEPTSHIDPEQVNKKHEEILKSSKPKPKSMIEQQQQQSTFLHFHPQCPSGLVTPQSPTLTDDST